MSHSRLIVSAVLVALACDSSTGAAGGAGDKAGKGDPKQSSKADAGGAKADAKKVDAKATDTKVTLAKKAEGERGDVADVVAKAVDGEAKANPDDAAIAPGDGKDGAEAKAEPAAPAVTSGRFSKGDLGEANLSPAELVEYAIAQGDPARGTFDLVRAFEGDAALADPKQGKLEAVLKTTMGDITCELFEDSAPGTVANFVGLARGTRPTYDKAKDEWVKIPYYDGVVFHRVIKDFMIQTGDRTGSGTGSPGYMIADEIDKTRKHSRAGTLSMANRGPNTGSSQFFVTAAKTPHLDGLHAVFGQCDTKTVIAISEVATDPRLGNRPYDAVKIERVEIRRTPKK